MADDIFNRYPQLRGNPWATALLCQALQQHGKRDDAYLLGIAAVEAAPGDEAVRDVVHAVLSASIPKYHRRMLRDGERNRCYAKAIERMVRPGMLVLEIGTGSGLIAMMAARAGATVVTCEANPTMAAAACEIIRRNRMADRVHVVAKHSTDLQIGQDIPAPADLLISELFGNSLFEEGVEEAIADARARLLSAHAPILPDRAELRLALATSDRPIDSPLGDVEGFDLSAFNVLSPPPRLTFSARDRPALRSDPRSALGMDFSHSPVAARCERVELVSHGGRIDGVAQWLKIDFGEGVVYENGPEATSDAHWGIPFRPFVQPRYTEPGQAVAIDVRLAGSELLVAPAR